MFRWSVLLALLLWVPGARAAVPSLYLVQTSGWMEPFFTDPASPFKPLLKALVEASHTDRVMVGSFNQDNQVPGHRSPEVAYDGPFAAGAVGSAVDGLSLAVRPGNRLADADFVGALVRALNEVLGGKPGIIWIVTNNKNSRNNSPEINRNTRAFAEMVRSSPYLPFVAAYPVRMPVAGRLYTERGLIIYAVAYGEEAGAELARIVDAGPMRALFTDPPFKLKHLEQAPLVFTAPGAGASGVVLEAMPEGGTVRVTGSLRSEYYPQTISRADVSLHWRSIDGVADPAGLRAEVQPPVLAGLASGSSTGDVTLVLQTPAVVRPPGLSGLMASTAVLHGTAELRLSNLSLALGDDFVARMGEIAALDQLPDVFADYQRVTEAAAVLPVTLLVRFSPLPLLLLIGVGAVLLLLLVLLLWQATRQRTYAVPFDGRRRAFSLRPFRSEQVTLPDGRVLVVSGRLFGPHAHRIAEKPRRGRA